MWKYQVSTPNSITNSQDKWIFKNVIPMELRREILNEHFILHFNSKSL